MRLMIPVLVQSQAHEMEALGEKNRIFPKISIKTNQYDGISSLGMEAVQEAGLGNHFFLFSWSLQPLLQTNSKLHEAIVQTWIPAVYPPRRTKKK